jgi:hypothetical protein
MVSAFGVAAADSLPAATSLAQYSSQVIALFNNMKVPASILAGALVPLGVLTPLPVEIRDTKTAIPATSSTPVGALKNQGKNQPAQVVQQRTVVIDESESMLIRRLRKVYNVVALLSLLSNLIAVMWATEAVNQLTELFVAPAESPWHLIQRDYEIQWVATNAHFVFGMFGFAFCIGLRCYLNAGPYHPVLGRSLASLAVSGLLLMMSIVNRGVAVENGNFKGGATNVWSLLVKYIQLLINRELNSKTMGFLEISAVGLLVYGLILASQEIFGRGSDTGKAVTTQVSVG